MPRVWEGIRGLVQRGVEALGGIVTKVGEFVKGAIGPPPGVPSQVQSPPLTVGMYPGGVKATLQTALHSGIPFEQIGRSVAATVISAFPGAPLIEAIRPGTILEWTLKVNPPPPAPVPDDKAIQQAYINLSDQLVALGYPSQAADSIARTAINQAIRQSQPLSPIARTDFHSRLQDAVLGIVSAATFAPAVAAGLARIIPPPGVTPPPPALGIPPYLPVARLVQAPTPPTRLAPLFPPVTSPEMLPAIPPTYPLALRAQPTPVVPAAPTPVMPGMPPIPVPVVTPPVSPWTMPTGTPIELPSPAIAEIPAEIVAPSLEEARKTLETATKAQQSAVEQLIRVGIETIPHLIPRMPIPFPYAPPLGRLQHFADVACAGTQAALDQNARNRVLPITKEFEFDTHKALAWVKCLLPFVGLLAVGMGKVPGLESVIREISKRAWNLYFAPLYQAAPVTPEKAPQLASGMLLQAMITGFGAQIAAGIAETFTPTKYTGLPQIAAVLGDLAGFSRIAAATAGVATSVGISTPMTYNLQDRLRPILPSDRDLIALAGEYAITKEEFRNTMRYHGYSDFWIDKLYELTDRPLGIWEYRHLAQAGLLSPELIDRELKNRGYNERTIPYLKEMLAKLSAGELRGMFQSSVARAYRMGLVTDAELKEHLENLGFSGPQLDKAIYAAKLDKATEIAEETKKLYLEQFRAGLITEGECLAGIIGAGFDSTIASVELARVKTKIEAKLLRTTARKTESEMRKLQTRYLELYRLLFRKKRIDETQYDAYLKELGVEDQLRTVIIAIDTLKYR